MESWYPQFFFLSKMTVILSAEDLETVSTCHTDEDKTHYQIQNCGISPENRKLIPACFM